MTPTVFSHQSEVGTVFGSLWVRSTPLGHWDGGWRSFVRRRGRPPPQCLPVRVRVWIRKRLWLNCCVIYRDNEGIRFYIFLFLVHISLYFYTWIFYFYISKHDTFVYSYISKTCHLFCSSSRSFFVNFFLLLLKKMWHDTRRNRCLWKSKFFIYYESKNRKLKTRYICGCRCYERLQPNTNPSWPLGVFRLHSSMSCGTVRVFGRCVHFGPPRPSIIGQKSFFCFYTDGWTCQNPPSVIHSATIRHADRMV